MVLLPQHEVSRKSGLYNIVAFSYRVNEQEDILLNWCGLSHRHSPACTSHKHVAPDTKVLSEKMGIDHRAINLSKTPSGNVEPLRFNQLNIAYFIILHLSNVLGAYTLSSEYILKFAIQLLLLLLSTSCPTIMISGHEVWKSVGRLL